MMKNKTKAAFSTAFFATALLVLFFGAQLIATATQPSGTPAVFDDFEDNDASDWGYFGGNNAGGGYGTADDRPKEGSYYLSTGWGGQGTASGFYGGIFKNLDNAAQLVMPVDPWFNVWVYNQSDATVDTYTLEVTIREDLNGDGWTNGLEDSFRLDTVFPNTSFNDQWVLLSAPVSSFTDLFTGGDGTFNGNLDEMVIVIAGVAGTNPSTVEVDFDYFAFTSGGPLAGPPPPEVFDDFEDNDASDWGFFGGNNAGGGGGTLDDRPKEGSYYLSTGWGGQGTASGFYGGAFKNLDNAAQLVMPADPWFNVWVYNQSDATVDTYTLEITIREDLNGDGWTNGLEDSFRLDTVFPNTSFNDQWVLLSAPVNSFTDLFTGGDGTFDGNLDEMVIVIAGVAGTNPSTVEVDFDYFAFTSGGPLEEPPPMQIIDDFENGLPMGTDGDGVDIGFYTFNGAASSIAITVTDTITPPGNSPLGLNNVLQMDTDSTSFAGFIHAFENPAVDTWLPQNWASFEGFGFWLYGTNSGTSMFIDILDNRNPGSTSDDAERFTVAFVDDFSGWQRFEFPFSAFTRKEIGNGAPNDGFTLTDVHGWALGVINTSGPRTYYVDGVYVYGEAELPDLTLSYLSAFYETAEGTAADVTVKVNRPIGARPDDPAQVSVDYFTESVYSAIPGLDYDDVAGTLTFIQGGPSELTFQVPTFDDNKYEGTERVLLRLTNPISAALGVIAQSRIDILDDEIFDPLLRDDFERGAFYWEGQGPVDLSTLEIPAGSPLALPGQGVIETVLRADFPSADPSPRSLKRSVINDLRDLLPSGNPTTDRRIRRVMQQIRLSLTQTYWENTYFLVPVNGRKVFNHERLAIKELQRLVNDGVPESPDAQAAIDTLLAADATLAQVFIQVAIYNEGNPSDIALAEANFANAEAFAAGGQPVQAVVAYGKAWGFATKAVYVPSENLGAVLKSAAFGRDLALGEDWSSYEAINFWFYGTGSGDTVTVTLKDNRAPDPGPGGWTLQWADEFNEPAGTLPNPDNWGYEIGDGTTNGIPGWGNDELQYYTDSPDNAAMDGLGNLVITAREADGSLECYYGTCDYTSARLLSQYRADFAYGRIESRFLVPEGEGLWPAIWSLGTDIGEVGWPQTGEIDIMEFVGRLPDEIFGTIHGPGYSGGASFGDIYNFGEPVFNDFHTIAIEWQPDLIEWYVDDILFHTATPADVNPNEWVFNDPVFLLLNVAIGGNFGGPVGGGTVFPQSMTVDYVRVYQGEDTAERFEAGFVDDTPGWTQVQVPFTAFTRSADQPAGAPNDGLTLTEVWGYGFQASDALHVGKMLVDQVRLVAPPAPTDLVVTTLADNGAGSLREALGLIADGGLITFDPGLAGGTIALSTGQLVIDRDVTVDGSGAPGLIVSGNNASRVFQIAGGVEASLNDLTISDGVGAPQGGGVRNYGTLNLDAVVVTNNTEMSAGPPNFEFGGGGIYNGDGAVLNLLNSTVSDNATLNQPAGGIYGFFNSTINITNTTVSGNVAADVAGGLRSLGDVNILNSTFSGNVSTAWHGGAIFHTDGQLNITNTSVVSNTAPGGTAGGILVATFGAPADMYIVNSIVAFNTGSLDCAIEGGGAATITSGGHNIDSDNSCNLIATGDQPGVNPLMGPLANNGGPTLTHALLAGSPAIDAGDNVVCPPTDQRGVARDASCDIGSYEFP